MIAFHFRLGLAMLPKEDLDPAEHEAQKHREAVDRAREAARRFEEH